MIICSQEFSEEIIKRIQNVIDTQEGITRVKLSQIICEWLNWRGRNGKLKEMSCRVALKKLEEKGEIKLPPSSGRIPSASYHFSNEHKALDIPEIECKLSDLGKVEIIEVRGQNKKESRIWRDLMDIYHYLGSGPLCGAQIRYLIKSERHGYLGGFSFSASAWQVGVRDEWIGWSKEERKKNLDLVVANSRFLIVPTVRVKNLASRVLSLSAKRLREDWNVHYGYEPVLLETYIEKGRFLGTSYKAANWQYIGETKGRGRQDRKHRKDVPVKDIYVYPLVKDAREYLCDPDKSVLTPDNEITYTDWAEEEFGRVDLGDKRLSDRLLTISRDFYARPQGNIPQVCGTRAKTKAAYRFFNNESTEMERLLSSHYESTIKRMQGEKVVLAVQDSTSFNYSTHPMTEGLGPIRNTGDKVIGIILHDTLVFNEEGTPLGLIDAQCWARDKEEIGKKYRRHELPIEEKESNKWLVSFRKASVAQVECPETRIVSVGDREADIYELFKEAEGEGKAKLLVRASHDRMLREEIRLWEKMADEPVKGIQSIYIPRKGNRESRNANLEVRYSRVELKPPKNKAQLGEIEAWVIYAQEEGRKDNEEHVEWMLLSNILVNSFDDAVEKLRWYMKRWGIEVYHKTLKSGCKIEERQLGSAETIQSCLAIDLVVGWRIYHLAKLGRETPEVPCSVYFEEEEWRALVAFITKDGTPVQKEPTLREAIHMVASLGGFLGRKGDGEPGTKSLWLGLQRLDDITAAFKVMWAYIKKNFGSVSSAIGCG